jgi:uncharacterized RDD family membrane protein YckC
VRGVPSRISPESFPIAATATAPAYDFDRVALPERAQPSAQVQTAEPGQQQKLFTTPVNEPRVVAFDSLTSATERESIRARAHLVRPAPVKSARVEVRRPRLRKPKTVDQRRLDFQEREQEVSSPPVSNIICDAPVAPVRMRAEAALIDGLLVLAGYAAPLALFLYKGGDVTLGKHVFIFLCAALLTVPLFYKLLWAMTGRDSFGMQCVGIRLVDFDGNPPSQQSRYIRLFGSILSLLAAGVGLIWTLVDQDRLSWHDHISSTFPTIDSDTH